MTRDEIFAQCVQKIAKTNCLLLEAATGLGKSAISIRVINHLMANGFLVNSTNPINILLLVAKRVHKQTWKDEIDKWGGFHHPNEGYLTKINVKMECYESLKNHCREYWDFILADEVHHIGSEARLEFLNTMSFNYFIGLSATIPKKLKMYFKYKYHSEVVSCGITEAIEDEVLPEPEILLFPLKLDNTIASETWEINPKSKGPIVYDEYKNIWKYKGKKIHAILKCTQKQKSNELNSLILWEKNQYMRTRNKALEQMWLYHCGQRLEFYADIKVPIVKEILKHLQRYRTITFCKTIEQCEQLGKNCIHSQNKDADKVYEKFNQKKINHITAVNILNENANLVDCKYAIFGNLSSSEVVQVQRTGRALRHKKPVIVIPYYQGTREEELVQRMTEGFNKDFVKTINSINEI